MCENLYGESSREKSHPKAANNRHDGHQLFDANKSRMVAALIGLP
jgi:hypothetical protein